MATLSDIKRRITSIQSTQKITSAMKMVSAAKLRRAQDAIESARPYAARMRATLQEVGSAEAGSSHPLFEERESVSTVELVAISSDRGLAGAFNSQIVKEAERLVAEWKAAGIETRFTVVGKKAAEYFRRHRPSQISDDRPVGPKVNYLEAQQIAQRLMSDFENGEVDQVVLLHNEFISAIAQTPKIVPLLPFVSEKVEAEVEAELDLDAAPYEIEPSSETLLASLVPKAVEVEVFRALLENQAGEHAARMSAMENATKNTEELIERLTLEYNRARQAAITSELVEIITGAQALE
ncbi:MAG: ATP synthase F1 subunit gamma [Myxococcota bacterium]|nr:ATP synthase F1 subunit gamma [Spirochaeta sp.]MAI26806.1 ATP synthase F1 subunit gamma [Spirochaeta sp.]RPG07926.1 MAG: ATP synthase F1 subunit gamma [Proteobacteria bacterium TMED72]RPG14114.1 MAG: ATP synthase F1 subunit gamma [Proteobacteria bacterium TMED72]